MSASGFGPLLQQLRRQRRLSQQAMAAAAGLSQRHVCFLETGRARPGTQALPKLMAALALSTAEASAMVAAAGLTAPPAGLDWQAPQLARLRAITAQMLAAWVDVPAYVMDAGGSLLARNPLFCALLAQVPGIPPAVAANIHDLVLHPDGLAAAMVAPDQLVPALLRRLRRSALTQPAAAATLARVLRYPVVKRHGASLPRTTDLGVIGEHYQLAGQRWSFVAATASFLGADQALTAGIEVEALFPADDATRQQLASIARRGG
jgi:transcriptional regulator with XRE-family HTH domain